jgi:hypothetical protein
MEIQDLLNELGQQTGLGSLRLNEQRVCRLVFDDRLTVDIEALADNQRFFIHAVVGQAPVEGREAAFAELLAANLFGQDTGGACLSLNRNHDEILLFKEFRADETDYLKFSSALEMFLNRLDHWKNRLLSADVGSSFTSDAAIILSNSFIRA